MNNIRLPIIYAALVTAALMVAGCAKPKAVVPTSFVTYTATDKDFRCDSPNGWASSSFSSGGTESGVDITSADAEIRIDSDAAGSMMGDIAGGMGTGTIGSATPSTVPPVEKLHAMQQQEYSKQLHEYDTDHTTSTYGDGRVTEWKSSDLHGYRATILGHDRSVSVECQCSEVEWPTLKAAFLRITNSIQPAGGS